MYESFYRYQPNPVEARGKVVSVVSCLGGENGCSFADFSLFLK
ncbi:hypothetical protein EVA_08442 [gut metagenome]|uniref:Uncharacterized protein n=1 Tax=gut metagenome TaxID=749906 RepID=J9G867_9ZZZZ